MAQCDYCNGEMLTVTGCTAREYTIDGNTYPSIVAHPHGDTCHDCGARENEPHHFGCDMETCPHCGGQLLSCGHMKQAAESLDNE